MNRTMYQTLGRPRFAILSLALVLSAILIALNSPAPFNETAAHPDITPSPFVWPL